MRCSAGPRSPSTTSRHSASSVPGCPGHPSTGGPAAWRPRRAAGPGRGHRERGRRFLAYGRNVTIVADANHLDAVARGLCLIFNEGYTTTSGPALQRTDLTAEAIRLTRLLHQLLPCEAEVAGLLALMLLTDARRAARTGTDGHIVPLADQRRDLWDPAAIAEGQAILTQTLGTGPVGPYQLQAAIAALHDEVPTAETTDWPQILTLYDVLTTVAPGPVVTLSRAVALAYVHGPRAGLALLGTLDTDERMTHTHRLEAVRAHLLEQAGDTTAARDGYLRAPRMTASLPERRYLELRAASLHHFTPTADPPG